MTNPKIGLYARVSSVAQAREKTIDSQISAIIDHAETLEEQIDPTLYFIDDGFSGASLERPGLDQLRRNLPWHFARNLLKMNLFCQKLLS